MALLRPPFPPGLPPPLGFPPPPPPLRPPFPPPPPRLFPPPPGFLPPPPPGFIPPPPGFLPPHLVYSRLNTIDEYDSGISDNPMVQNQITNHLHLKFLDKWLVDDFSYLLKNFSVNNLGVVVRNKKGATNKKLDEQDTNAIVDYIEDHYLSKDKTHKILKKIVVEENIKWHELPHNEGIVKRTIAHYLRRKLEEK